MERGDPKAAAAVVVEMKEVFSTMPSSVHESDVAEVRGLLHRYGVLGEELRQRTMVAMNRLGAARRSRVYRRQGIIP